MGQSSGHWSTTVQRRLTRSWCNGRERRDACPTSLIETASIRCWLRGYSTLHSCSDHLWERGWLVVQVDVSGRCTKETCNWGKGSLSKCDITTHLFVYQINLIHCFCEEFVFLLSLNETNLHNFDIRSCFIDLKTIMKLLKFPQSTADSRQQTHSGL